MSSSVVENSPAAVRSESYGIWVSVALAGFIYMVCIGVRMTVGLFVHPIMEDKGLGIVTVSTALAIGQLNWGLFQPLFGLWVDKGHAFAALCTGCLCIAAGQVLTIWIDGPLTLTFTLGLLSPSGVAAGSFGVLIGIVGARMAAEKQSLAGGLINAAGSLGQFIFAPITHFFMLLRGYYGGLIFLAVAALTAILPSYLLSRDNRRSRPLPQAGAEKPPLRAQLAVAFKDKSYILLHTGFFTCGFHVAFLITHLPGEIISCGHSAAVSAASISLIGLCNVAGSIGSGILGGLYRMKYILAWVYASRAVIIAVYLAAPKTELTFYIFACAIGLTWLATIPPTAGIVDKLFGKAYLATLFGLTFLTHQVGGFLGAWLGGIALEMSGNYLWMWYIDIILAVLAAIVNLPIREDPVVRRAPAAS